MNASGATRRARRAKKKSTRSQKKSTKQKDGNWAERTAKNIRGFGQKVGGVVNALGIGQGGQNNSFDPSFNPDAQFDPSATPESLGLGVNAPKPGMKKSTKVILIVGGIIVAGVAAYLIWKSGKPGKSKTSVTPTRTK
jgi:hypothetical protein